MGRTKIVNKPNLKDAKCRLAQTKYIKYGCKPSSFLLSVLKNRKYFIRTYGCQGNMRDEETMAGLFESCGMIRVYNEELADIILLNTCAIRENAEDKVFGEIGNIKILKKNNKNLIIGVCGCMVQQTHIVDKIVSTYNQVDFMFGTHNIYRMLDIIEEVIRSKKRIVDVPSNSGDIIEIKEAKRIENHKAFVNITYGCNKFCTYCIVPYTRGKERSRKKEDIFEEIKILLENGYKEVTLLGQNVNSYGNDLYEDYNFANLLEDCAKMNIPRLRFTTSHPFDFKDDMIDVIAKYDNIMKLIHLPVQSGSDKILQLMNRRYTVKSYLDLIDRIKAKIPNIALSTDIIVGFPNESNEEFEDTLKLIDKVQYDFAYTFIYSPREGTPAALINDNITKEEKTERYSRLVKHLEKYMEPKSLNMVGKTFTILVDSVSKKNDKNLSGYTEQGKLVNFKGDPSLIGQIVNVRILESHTYSMIGEIFDDSKN